MSPTFRVILLFAAASMACVAAAPRGNIQAGEYVLQSKPANRVQASLTLEVDAPKLRPSEWVLFAPNPPNIPAQKLLGISTTPDFGDNTQTTGQATRFRLPVEDDARSKLECKVRYDVQLYSRRLVPLNDENKPDPPPALTDEERARYTASTRLCDYEAGELQDWLKSQALKHREREDDIEYARRVFDTMKSEFTYTYTDQMDRRASAICRAGKSDCGGLSIVFVSAMRKAGIPARLLVGRWAQSAKTGEKINGFEYHQTHVKAEFYAEKIGWVPVDVSGAVERPRQASGYFGKDPGNFIVLHIGHDLPLDTIHFGAKNAPWLQSIATWVTGEGSLDEAKFKSSWVVENK